MKRRTASVRSERIRSRPRTKRGEKSATAVARKAAPRLAQKTRPALSSQRRGTQARGGSAKTTTDHDKIRAWAEARGGKPATVKGTPRGKQHAGIIRIDFPGYSGRTSLKTISWDEWFDMFEERELALIYQDRTARGKPSRFNKLIGRKARG